MRSTDYSRFLFAAFFAALFCSFGLMYYNFIELKNFETFTDEETVPEGTDFVASLFSSDEPETE